MSNKFALPTPANLGEQLELVRSEATRDRLHVGGILVDPTVLAKGYQSWQVLTSTSRQAFASSLLQRLMAMLGRKK